MLERSCGHLAEEGFHLKLMNWEATEPRSKP
jgi:hypothetical protein